MKIIETIQKRRSVRTFTAEPLREEHVAQIKQYISQLQAPFGIKARIELVHVYADNEPVKLGTYGWVKGACDFMALLFEDAPFAETAAAYIFEQAILYCTALGLGTCWIGGSFNRNDFKKQIQPAANEKLRIVSPVGYVSEKQRFLEKFIVGADQKHASRKPFGELFFDNDFNTPLTEARAGLYATPLEMVRIAPSANNKQEWRVLREDKALHFYKKPYLSFDAIDMGIALCHFELSCNELGIEGQFAVLNDYPASDKFQYVISWR